MLDCNRIPELLRNILK